ncbi:hypothetical protein [Kingella oralis]|nr:hypothetical protein [Kingella oralis]
MARRRLADICTKYKHTDYSMHDFGDEPSPFHFRFQAADDLSQCTACQQAVGARAMVSGCPIFAPACQHSKGSLK